MLRRPHLFTRKSLLTLPILVLLAPFSSCTKQPATTTLETTSRVQTTAKPQPATPLLSAVPFFGYPADGQQGPEPAPQGSAKQLPIPPEAAAKLAWYEFSSEDGDNISALAPRGWQCFVTYGSNGTFLYIAPEPLNAAKVLEDENWHGFTGPAIQLSAIIGDTSGRFEVAGIVARVFPKYRSYVKSVIAEGIEPAKNFPVSPFPKDILQYENDHTVDFTTPPNTEGLGTACGFLKNNLPISGIIPF